MKAWYVPRAGEQPRPAGLPVPPGRRRRRASGGEGGRAQRGRQLQSQSACCRRSCSTSMALGPLSGDRPDSYGQRVNDVSALPSGPLAAASLSLVQARASAAIAGHSIRTFLYARLLAGHEGRLTDAAYDENLLFAACVMHDFGLGTLATGDPRSRAAAAGQLPADAGIRGQWRQRPGDPAALLLPAGRPDAAGPREDLPRFRARIPVPASCRIRRRRRGLPQRPSRTVRAALSRRKKK